ncbi:hypothetical protein N826_25400 [Skermanella aerolata KACC 11604]|nr:hypothetical protein N826_25400 [Skermanella aerolata KACC 11604]
MQIIGVGFIDKPILSILCGPIETNMIAAMSEPFSEVYGMKKITHLMPTLARVPGP